MPVTLEIREFEVNLQRLCPSRFPGQIYKTRRDKGYNGKGYAKLHLTPCLRKWPTANKTALTLEASTLALMFRKPKTLKVLKNNSWPE